MDRLGERRDARSRSRAPRGRLRRRRQEGGDDCRDERQAPGGRRNSKPFPNLRVVYDTGTDYLDPGLSYTVQGWEAMWNVYLSLLGYKHVNGPDGATIVPALAQSLPDGLVGRPHVHVDPAQGPQVFERDAGEGE